MSSNIPRFASDAASATRSFCSASARVAALTMRIDRWSPKAPRRHGVRFREPPHCPEPAEMAQPGCRRMPILGRERTDGFGQSKCRSGRSLLRSVVATLDPERMLLHGCACALGANGAALNTSAASRGLSPSGLLANTPASSCSGDAFGVCVDADMAELYAAKKLGPEPLTRNKTRRPSCSRYSGQALF